MTGYNYSADVEEKYAKALGRSLSISTKQSVEICSFIRGKKLQKAKSLLTEVIAKKRAVPYNRYNSDTPHRKGMAAGRYPLSACKGILEVLKSVEANAQFKGLSVNDLVILHVSAKKSPATMHYGRRRRRAKRTHVEVIVAEVK